MEFVKFSPQTSIEEWKPFRALLRKDFQWLRYYAAAGVGSSGADIRAGGNAGFFVFHSLVNHALDLRVAEIPEGLSLDAAQESFADQFQKTLFLSPGGERVALSGAEFIDDFRGAALGEVLPLFFGEARQRTVLDGMGDRPALVVGRLCIRIGDHERSGRVGVAGVTDIFPVLSVVHLSASFFCWLMGNSVLSSTSRAADETSSAGQAAGRTEFCF